MNIYCYVVVAVAATAVIAFVAHAVTRKRRGERPCDSTIGMPSGKPHVDCSRFQEYIDIYEKRVLAYLIEEEAKRLGFDYQQRDRLRAEYGKELSFPPYGAQDWLSDRGVPIMDVTRMQREWIIQNGGNPDFRPPSREVVRIIKERNIAKVQIACRNLAL